MKKNGFINTFRSAFLDTERPLSERVALVLTFIAEPGVIIAMIANLITKEDVRELIVLATTAVFLPAVTAIGLYRNKVKVATGFIAAALLYKEIPVIPATPYIFRFWTEDFYLVSTVTVSNPVSIWHLPSEKDKGFIRMYERFIGTGQFPDIETSARYFGIVKARRPFNTITLSNKINGKIDSWKKKK